MLYRAYIPADFVALYAIEELCFEPPFRFGRRYMRQLVSSADSAAWIAEDGDGMAGFAIVEWPAEHGMAMAYLQTIEVAPGRRGQGVGAELLRRVEASARAAGAQSIWLHVSAENAGAIRLYEAAGYRGEGREEDYYGPGMAGLVYGKELAGKSAS